MWRASLTLLLLFCVPTGESQPLRNPDNEAVRLEGQQEPREAPLVLRSSANPPSAEESVQQAIDRLRREMREIAQSALTEAERREALIELYQRNARIFRSESTERDTIPLTEDEVVLKLEQMIFETALEYAPTEESREQVLDHAPAHLDLEPNRPILIAPAEYRASIVITRDAEEEGIITPWWRTTRFNAEALDLDEIEESPAEQLEPPEENEPEPVEEEVKVELLADEKVTVEMHDDATILRQVSSASGDLVLFDALHLWVGGAVQFDAQSYADLFNARNGGDSEADTLVRRGEVIVRSTLFDLGEVKWQYDLDSNIWRDLYYRRANTEESRTFTVGNQTEPMSQENMLGNKFNAAMEIAAPTSVFGRFKGMGATLNNWFVRQEGESFLGIGARTQSAITTSFGIYGEDIEDTNDTDLAATGRLTWGQLREDSSGLHLGLKATLRDGEFDRINPRPEFAEADRIVLARFDADTAAILGGEALYTKGSLHASSEVYVADFRGGDVDARGAGGFLEVGYYLTGQERLYRPQWGLWAPLQVGARNIFEVFGRISYTIGDSDDTARNDLRMITLGGSWYRYKFRTSVNLLYGVTDNNVESEDTGFGAAMRVQYLF